MKTFSTIKIYSILFFFIILGYVFMMFPELYLPPPDETEEKDELMISFIFQFSVLALLIITNIVTVYIFKLKREFSEYWSLKKLWFLPVGLLIGIIVMIIPIFTGVLSGQATWNDLKFNDPSSENAIIFWLIITLWEEIWFRGIFLNYAKRHISVVQISLFMGILFMISYSIYSQGNFLVVSPNFLLLGILFILFYFYFKTNWLTYGLLLGINIATTSSPFDQNWLIGKFGILTAILWGVLLFWMIRKYGSTISQRPIIPQETE